MYRLANDGLAAVRELPAGLVARHDAQMGGVRVRLFAEHDGAAELGDEDVLNVVLPPPFRDDIYRAPVYFDSSPAVTSASAFRALVHAQTHLQRAPLVLTDMALIAEGDEPEDECNSECSSEYESGSDDDDPPPEPPPPDDLSDDEEEPFDDA